LILPASTRAQGGSLEDRIEAQKKKLEKIQKQIEEHRTRWSELRSREKSLLKKVSALEKEETLLRSLIEGLRKREALLGEKIDSLRLRLAIDEEKLEWQRALLAGRLKDLYMRGPDFRWRVLLGAASLQEMLRRYKFLRLLARREAELVEKVKEHKTALEEERTVLTETLAEVSSLRKEREKEGQRLAAARRERLAVLKKIKAQKGKHEQAIAELKRSQQKIKSLLESMEKRREEEERKTGLTGKRFARLKGRMIMPVEGKIARDFGTNRHPRFGTVTFNSGIDIQAPSGSPVRAVAKGKVEFVDWIAGYGRCIIVNHGGGYYTLYAHVAEVFVEEGEMVSEGEVIAEVGDTGVVDGYGCHFEIRKSKEPLDPKKWFRRGR